nr:oxygenase MpaB family protein [Nocardioides speluncae]
MNLVDQGYFPPGSMLRHVQEHRAVGHTFGLRALILGATHPVPYVGTASASGYRDRPFQRLSRTAAAFETIFFGTRAEADKLLAGSALCTKRSRACSRRTKACSPPARRTTRSTRS